MFNRYMHSNLRSMFGVSQISVCASMQSWQYFIKSIMAIGKRDFGMAYRLNFIESVFARLCE